MSIDNKKVLFVDNSFIELLTTCPWKCWASSVAKRRLASETPALRLGSHIHATLAYRYKIEAFGKPYNQDVQFRILSKRFERTPCETEDWRNLDTAQKVIEAYNTSHPIEPFDIVNHNGFPLVEKPFAVEAGQIGDVTIIYTGRIDLCLRDNNNGLFVMDHKTTTMLGDTYWKDMEFSEQQRGYCWIIRKILGEEPLGYIVNVLAMRRPTKTGVPIEFQRQRFYTKEPTGQLDDWHQNMLAQVEEFLWHYGRGIFPRHHKHCIGKYGACEFVRVCELPEKDRATALASGAFKNNEWSPLYT